MNLTILTALTDTADVRPKVLETETSVGTSLLFTDVLGKGADTSALVPDVNQSTASDDLEKEVASIGVKHEVAVRNDMQDRDAEVEVYPSPTAQHATDGVKTKLKALPPTDIEVVHGRNDTGSIEVEIPTITPVEQFVVPASDMSETDQSAVRSLDTAEPQPVRSRAVGTETSSRLSPIEAWQPATSQSATKRERSVSTLPPPRANDAADTAMPRTEQRALMDAASSTKLSPTDRHLSGHTATLLVSPIASNTASGSRLIQNSVEFSSIKPIAGQDMITEQVRATPETAAQIMRHDRPFIAHAVHGKPDLGTAWLGGGSDISKPSINQAASLITDTATSVEGPFEQIVWDVRPLTTPGMPTVLQTRPDLPPHVAQQIAEALHRAPEKPLELVLNPPELGRVRMRLSPSDAGIVVSVVADRPETLDLMRRNIEDLGRSFEELGYEDISFSFAQGDQTEQDPDGSHQEAETARADPFEKQTTTVIPALISALKITPDGVDIRL
ncbi:flagellar hook-length control protein FliK [uncultured Tateyamaria sp.]|uniref:flagellar hook-length control protein FliK n=1 Tax=uncultured Tateyamaria sp. TaxID=455651 RepID=UPI0026056FC6|nr:flagellar hook-length control protein FliK [uncultured Tateyamaria sp.]